MFRIDAIFWTALGILVVAIALFAITGEQMWLALMLLSYLLRPTIASLGFAKRMVDERQMAIHYRSGNIAFAVIMITTVIVAVVQNANGDANAEFYNIIIIVGIATKAFFNVLLVKDYQKASRTIIIAVGLMALLFVVMSHGVSLESLAEGSPWLTVIALGLLAKKYPRVIGSIVFAATTVLLFFILGKGLTLGQGATALVICGPLYTAGACLFLPSRDESAEPAVEV
ncbi:MAG: hypothetical protein IPG71_02170 [bacterium]|nr:hypothetical protein [bacterium]